MTKPDAINWGNLNESDTAYFRTAGAPMSTALANNGYAGADVPDNQDHNTLFRNAYLWEQYLLNRQQANEPTLLYSSGTATWDGSALILSANLDMSFRIGTGVQINRIAAGTLTFGTDGHVLVLKKDSTTASPVTVTSGTYGSLTAGKYAILAGSSLTATDQENELLIFRRNGTNLEIPAIGLVYPTGSTITFGKSYETNAVPIGTIIPFYDFNGALSFDSSLWKYCDGSSQTVGSLGSQTLPDLSNRYLVGFGTEGGGDNDSAAWATSVVGNASHQVSLQHSHTVDSHTHTGPSHTHGAGTLQFAVGYYDYGNTGAAENFYFYNSGGSQEGSLYTTSSFTAGSNRAGVQFNNWGTTDGWKYTINSQSNGASASSGTADTGAATPTTDSALSTTQSIQPRSIRVRYLMRVK